ncbi:MAG: hypothetical protein V3R64_08675 [Sphingomonadales bacterium]
MSFLSRLVQRNLSGTFDAVAGRQGLALPGVENGTLEQSPQPSQTGTLPQAKTQSAPAIQRQVGLEIEDQPEEQVARSPAADKPIVDTKPRTPAEGSVKESSDIAKSPASPLEAKTSTENLTAQKLSPSPLGVQRRDDETFSKGGPEETAQRASNGTGAANEAKEPKEDEVISRKVDTTVQRKATPQKTVALGSPQGPSKPLGLAGVATPPNPKPAFLGKPQDAPVTVEPDNAPIPVKEPVLADKENVAPEALKGIATPVPDALELIPNTYKRPEVSGGLVANTPPPKAKPTVIIERIEIHVIDDQGTSKEPQADPLSTPLDAYYLRSF